MMGYIQGFCASIVSSGNVLRESPLEGYRTVRLPFNSEYQILLKNSNHLRCKVEILIDGLPISSLGKIVLNPGESTTIERFIDSYNSGKKFKFISREEGAATGALQDPTSDRLGLIEVRFWSATQIRKTVTNPPTGILRSAGVTNSSMQKSVEPTMTFNGGGQMVLTNNLADLSNGVSYSSSIVQDSMTFASASVLGGTAEGSHSAQQFHETEDFETVRTPAIITLRILAPETARYAIENGWVIKKPENIRITDTYKVEQGVIWAKLG